MKTEGRLIITCRGDRGSNKLAWRGVHYWERLGSYINSLQVGGEGRWKRWRWCGGWGGRDIG